MYIHKRCRPETIDLDYDMVEFGYCEICGVQGTIYHVKGSDDYFRTRRGGVTREYRDGVDVTSEPRSEPKFAPDEVDNITMPEPATDVVLGVVIEDSSIVEVESVEEEDTKEKEPDIDTLLDDKTVVADRLLEVQPQSDTAEEEAKLEGLKGDRELTKGIVERVAAQKAKYAVIERLKEQIAELEAKEE